MSNPSKQKGTAGETELKRLLDGFGLPFERTPASSTYDLTNANPTRLELLPIEVLATRPDRGRWLVTMDLSDFAALLSLTYAQEYGHWETHIEVKRYARFALHNIFEKKFGRKRDA